MRLLLAVAVALAPAPGLAQSTSEEAALRAIERQQRDAFVAGDSVALERLWSPNYLVNSPGDIVAARADVLDRVREGRIGYTAYDVTIERIAISGDLAVVMGAERVTPKKGSAAGQVVNRRFTDVWRRQGRTWIAIARHANAIVPALSNPAAVP